MEPRFGHEFSRVRVHTDTQAAESAQAVKALAYTVGSHVAFGSGMYAPQSLFGKSLIADELTHVAQQQLSPPVNGGKLVLGNPGDVHEQSADQIAEAISTEGDRSPFKPLARPKNIGSVLQRQTSKSPAPAAQAVRRDLTDDEHKFVNPIEHRRIEMSITAAGLLINLLQRIITGDPDLLRSSDQPAARSKGKKAAGKSAAAGSNDKERVWTSVRRHLNLGYLFQWGRSSFDWLNDPRADQALKVIQTATNMIINQASRRLPRKVRVQSDPRSWAEKPLAEEIMLFDPTFFDSTQWKTNLCWTWVLMHEYMHLAGAFHGENIAKGMEKWPEYKPEFALANADNLTALVFDLALGKPFDVNCHTPGA